MGRPLLRPVPVEALGRRRDWGRLDIRPAPSDLSVFLAKGPAGADAVDDEEEEEEEETQELAPQGRREKSTESARYPSCCWAHWSSTAVAVVVDESAAAAVAAAAAAASSCESDGKLEPVDECVRQEDDQEEVAMVV